MVLSAAASRVTPASDNAASVFAVAIDGVACAKRWWQQSAVDPAGTHDPRFDVREALYYATGVDRTALEAWTRCTFDVGQ